MVQGQVFAEQKNARILREVLLCVEGACLIHGVIR
jgi:hypothetical protein